MKKTSKYWETSHVVPAGDGLVHCSQCSEPVALTASSCPACGSKEYYGFYKRRHSHEETNDNVVIVTALALGLLGVVNGIATSSGTLGAIFAATWQGIVGLLFGVPIGVAINFMRSFGRRDDLG
jgi:DNA-directed RNA polymerase subunit RPC12/RpoP